MWFGQCVRVDCSLSQWKKRAVASIRSVRSVASAVSSCERPSIGLSIALAQVLDQYLSEPSLVSIKAVSFAFGQSGGARLADFLQRHCDYV